MKVWHKFMEPDFAVRQESSYEKNQQVTLADYRRATRYEIMRLEGNKSGVPIDTLENIKQSFTVM